MLTISFEARYALKLGLIFDETLHNIDQRHRDKLRTFFEHSPKLYLGVNVEAKMVTTEHPT